MVGGSVSSSIPYPRVNGASEMATSALELSKRLARSTFIDDDKHK